MKSPLLQFSFKKKSSKALEKVSPHNHAVNKFIIILVE